MDNSGNKYELKFRCYEFSKEVVLFINQFAFKRVHYSIIDLLLRSATLIGANVMKGKSGNSIRNLIHFYSIALRSADETKYWLCLVRGDILEADKVQPSIY